MKSKSASDLRRLLHVILSIHALFFLLTAGFCVHRRVKAEAARAGAFDWDKGVREKHAEIVATTDIVTMRDTALQGLQMLARGSDVMKRIGDDILQGVQGLAIASLMLAGLSVHALRLCRRVEREAIEKMADD